MIQLKIYQTTDKDTATAVFLDLYETSPIKLTLSIEDITNAEASSVFSKTFKVPATRDNNEFFKNAYEVDGIDFDVTTKKPAEIIVDGAEFRQGHIRLQKIYTNGDLDKIDYELLFLGETRDFSSVIADRTLCQITMTDFSWLDLPVSYTNANDFIGPYDYNDIQLSWQAFPQTTSLTAGTADGDLLFPLIDHGNTYTAGVVDQGRIALGNSGSGSFTHSANKLDLTRFKPMIRAKRVWDQIFEDAGYTYSSDFLNTDRFHQMYLSAFGNNEQIGMEIDQTTTTIFESSNQFGSGNDVDEYMFNPLVISNVGNYYSINGPSNGSYFVCPGAASAGGNFYIMSASAQVDASIENSDYSDDPIFSAVQLVVVNGIGGSITQVLATGNYTYNGNTSSVTWDSRNGGYQPAAGDIIQCYIDPDSSFVDYSAVTNTYWDCTAAPGAYLSTLDLDCEYNQIDFIKDVLTMFRLVMQPDVKRPNNFIIEPWQEFIGSGKTYDWSDKINLAKDQILEPLFNTQSQEIEFTMQEDEDYINTFHQDNNKHAYGWLRFNSANELLKGKRKIEVIGIAPTPIDQIELATSGVHPAPDFILPIIHTHDDNTAANEHVPIKPKTRFLFYNGKIPISVQQDYWYMTNDTGGNVQQQTYPLVTPYENWPVQTDSLNLNFSNDTRYYISPNPGAGYNQQGSTLYDEYWSRYINSLYNRFSRRLTATFILNNVDLQDFSFDDIIFVNGKYYRPEKIIDVEVGASDNTCKVQLITLKDQRPVWLDEPLTGFSVVTNNTNCTGATGTIQVTTNGTPDFTWTLLESGASGSYAAPTGQAPYIFQIDAAVGPDTLTVIDSVGREAQIQVTVPASTTLPITTSFVKSDPTVCVADEGQCNGSISVTVNNAVAPAITYWLQEQGVTGNTRTNLCEGIYQYYVVDANGCESDVVTVELICDDGQERWDVALLAEDCITNIGGLQSVSAPAGQLSAGDIITLNTVGGCYEVVSTTQLAPQYTFLAEYIDCATCQTAQPDYVSWKVESCTTVGVFEYVPNNTGATLSPGLVIEITNAGAANGCYTVIEESIVSPTYLVTNVFQDCATCETPPTEYIYFIEACDDSFGTYATSTLSNITLGSIMQITPSGTCVSVGQLVTGQTPVDVLDDTTFYTDCDDCNGITPSDVCTYVTGTSPGGSNGTYTAAGFPFNWSVMDGQTIVLCASNFVIISGTVDTITGGSCGVEACPPPENYYKIENCEQQLIGYAEQDYTFSLGDVVQYQINGVGATYCGTIIDIGFFPVTPDYVLAGPIAYECDDIIHCNQ